MNELGRNNCNDEINLLEYWKVILKYKKMIASIVVSASIIAVISSLLMTNIYEAKATIIPISSRGGAGLASLASSYGGLASIAGLSMPSSSSDSEKFMVILGSRTLAENVIKKENLMPVFFEDAWDKKENKWRADDIDKQPKMESAVVSLNGMIKIAYEKKVKTINISAYSKDKELSARLANAYVSELQNFINSNSLTMAKRNRAFIEDQLQQNKTELLEAGKEINDFYKGGRVSASDSKVDVSVEPVADVVSDVSSPPVLAHLDAIDALLSKKVDVDAKLSEAKTVKNVPQQVYLTYLMLRRELLTKVNAMLVTQLEMAKIEESKEELSFQIIDKAVPPLKKFKPKRAQICKMFFLVSLIFSIFLAFFLEYFKKMKELSSQCPKPKA